MPTNATAGLTRARTPIVPSAVLGALIFVAAEMMFFSGIMSALTITRAGAGPGMWPAAAPFASLAGGVGIAIVLASGALLVAARGRVARQARAARPLLFAATLLGGLFIALQLTQLLVTGLTMRSGAQTSFLLLTTGLHTAHALAVLVALFVAWRRLVRGTLTPGFFGGVQVFWYFAAVLWPIIYLRVYV